jgi:hypothetical protein
METQMIFISTPHCTLKHHKKSKKQQRRSPWKPKDGCKFLYSIGYKKTREKGQGSAAEMASLKRVKEESARDLGMLLMIYENQTKTT